MRLVIKSEFSGGKRHSTAYRLMITVSYFYITYTENMQYTYTDTLDTDSQQADTVLPYWDQMDQCWQKELCLLIPGKIWFFESGIGANRMKLAKV